MYIDTYIDTRKLDVIKQYISLQMKTSHLHYKYCNMQAVKAIIIPCCCTSTKQRCILWAKFRDPNAETGCI